MRTYQVNVRKATKEEGGGYWAEVEGMPGCFAGGRTLDALYEDIRGAIELYIDWLKEHDEPIPEGTAAPESWRWDVAVA